MSIAKIEVVIGQFRFSGEGEQKWLTEQMEKILSSAEKLIQLSPVKMSEGNNSNTSCSAENREQTQTTLPEYLDKTNTKNNTDIYLATAQWLHDKGEERLTTKLITEALQNAKQDGIGNAAQCLANNIKNGRAEKVGNTFYVTSKGRNHLGLK